MMLSIVELRVLVVFAVIGVVITLFLLGVIIAELICIAKKGNAKKRREKLRAYNDSLEYTHKKYDALDKENKELRYKIDVLLKDKKW